MTSHEKLEPDAARVDELQSTEFDGPRGAYEPPMLTMHGSLQDITRGLTGPATDGDFDQS
jgi:hypothetical protein